MITRYPEYLTFLDVETGTAGTVNGHHGMIHTVDYMEAIGLGLVSGHSHFVGKGRRDSLATTAGGDDISDLVSVSIPIPNQAGEQMAIVSDSANDTAAGTGARTVKVHYIDASGTYLHEVVTMNGVTPVNLAASNVRFVQQITVETLGTFGGSNAGNITIYSTTTPANIFCRIVTGNNVSLSSARMIPAGVDFWLTGINVSATTSKAVSVRLTATCDHAGVYTPGVFQFNEIVECQDFGMSIQFDIPRKIPALSIIKGKAVSVQAGGSVAISYDGWTE